MVGQCIYLLVNKMRSRWTLRNERTPRTCCKFYSSILRKAKIGVWIVRNTITNTVDSTFNFREPKTISLSQKCLNDSGEIMWRWEHVIQIGSPPRPRQASLVDSACEKDWKLIVHYEGQTEEKQEWWTYFQEKTFMHDQFGFWRELGYLETKKFFSLNRPISDLLNILPCPNLRKAVDTRMTCVVNYGQ